MVERFPEDISIPVEGEYTARSVAIEPLRAKGYPEKTFAVFKGDYVMGFISDHPCGEWTFIPSTQCPSLRHESLVVIATMIRDAECTYRLLRQVIGDVVIATELAFHLRVVSIVARAERLEVGK